MSVSTAKYSIEQSNGITTITAYESLTFDEVIGILDYIATEDIYRLRCFDMSAVQLTYTRDDVVNLASHSKQIFSEKNRSAIVVSDDLAYGIIRSLMAYRDEAQHMQMNVFREVTPAKEWLESQKSVIFS